MEVLIGIAGLAGFFLVIFLFRKGVSRASGAIEGAITGNTRSRGKTATSLETHFSAPIDGPTLIGKLLDALELPEQASLRAGLFLGSVSEDGSQAVINGGTRIATTMQFVVATSPAGEGCTGMATTASWTESDGLVTWTDEIERLHAYARSVAESLGGTSYEQATA